MRCIVCSQHIDDDTMPAGAFFITHGGNDIFDPTATSYLEIYVCDFCLLYAAGGGDVMHATVTDNDVSIRQWQGEDSKRH